MANLGVVFLTGLTTGGLSCLAVQGGLLASYLARQAEKDVRKEPAATSTARTTARYNARNPPKKRKQRHEVYRAPVVLAEQPKRQLTLPIVLFLGSKLAAYTLLGLLLGWIGSMLQLTPYGRAVLQLAIGIFMVGTALRMFNVHPIFRYFVVEPPSFLTRYIRKTAKNDGHDVITPSFLGALTVLIPCGVTQAMMALAIAAGTPVAGAAIMFAFTLGTSPVFFTLAYLATRLGERMQGHFLKFAAATILLLGLISIETGLNLTGSRFSVANLIDALMPAPAVQAQQFAGAPANTGGSDEAAVGNEAVINAGDFGYAPNVVRATAHQPVKLTVVTNNTYGCTRSFVIPTLNIQEILPETGRTSFDLPAQPAGTIRFSCSMGMYRGRIVFE